MSKKNRKGRFLHDDQQTRVNIAAGIETKRKEVLTFHPVVSVLIDEATAIEDAKKIYGWLNDHLSLMAFYHLGVMMGVSAMDIEKRFKDDGQKAQDDPSGGAEGQGEDPAVGGSEEGGEVSDTGTGSSPVLAENSAEGGVG